jgi:manganese/iron transport system permease protein/iron/zinc/copper transport system permease protein
MFEPLEYEFFVRGLIGGTIASGLCAFIGIYVILRRMSYIGHGLSHAIFGGAVVSFVMGFNFYIGSTIWGFGSALLIIAMTRFRKFISSDAAIGIITTSSFALGVALISHYHRFTRNFDAALFGNILGITNGDLFALAAVGVLTVATVIVLYRRLLFTTFDPEVAPFFGVSTNWMDAVFALILACVIVVSLRILGATLIAATLVIPPVTARLATDHFGRMMGLSVLIGSLCGFFGVYLSYYIDIASGAAIVLLSAAVFAVVLAYTSIRMKIMQLKGQAGAEPSPHAQAPQAILE